MVRKAMRKPAVLGALGWANSTFYAAIKKGKFPKGTKLDPDGHVVVWFEDQVEAFQIAAIERQSVEATMTTKTKYQPTDLKISEVTKGEKTRTWRRREVSS